MDFKFFSSGEQRVEEKNNYRPRSNNQISMEEQTEYDIKSKLEFLDHMSKQTEEMLALEQYKLVASSYEAIQQRRIGNNNVFIFIYSVIIGLYNLLSNEHVPLADAHLSYSMYMVFLLGMIVGFLWIDVSLNIIRGEKYKRKLLNIFESHMPLRIFSNPVARSSKDGEKNYGAEKLLTTRNFDLILPIFMIISLAINFFFMFFG